MRGKVGVCQTMRLCMACVRMCVYRCSICTCGGRVTCAIWVTASKSSRTGTDKARRLNPLKYAGGESEGQRAPLPPFIFLLLSVGTRGRDESRMSEGRGYGVVSLDGRRYGWLRIDQRQFALLGGHPRPLRQHRLSLCLPYCSHVSLSFSLSARVSAKVWKY